MHWPVVIMYPESMQQDAIEAFAEDITVGEQLDEASGIFRFL